MELKQLIYSNLPNTRKEWIWFGLLMLIVITLGLFAFNQYLAITYKTHLILNPCSLCETYEKYSQTGINFRIEDINLTPANYTKYTITPLK